MNLRTGISAFAALLLANTAAAGEQELSKRVLQQDGWVSYQVPMVADAGSPCCLESYGKHASRTGSCDLDNRSWNISSDEHGSHSVDGTLALYLHVEHGHIDKMRAFGAACPIREGQQIRLLDNVGSADSIAMLSQSLAHAEFVKGDSLKDVNDIELAAIALHADDAATAALARLADKSHPRKLREQALFWSGQLRGKTGAELVERVARTDPDAELRAEAIFALSESHGMDVYAAIQNISLTDSSEHVREQAMFWMAQMGDARAAKDITAAISTETSEKVREQAVFALSQLKDKQAEKALIALMRGNYPRKVKEQALFWLGQSGSDEAMDFLDQLLSKPAHSAKEG